MHTLAIRPGIGHAHFQRAFQTKRQYGFRRNSHNSSTCCNLNSSASRGSCCGADRCSLSPAGKRPYNSPQNGAPSNELAGSPIRSNAFLGFDAVCAHLHGIPLAIHC